MKLIFICSPFRGKTLWDVAKNVQVAEHWAFEVSRLGAAPVCPQTMWQHFNGTMTDEFWLAACVALMKQCDAVFVVPKQRMSSGCANEIEIARGLEMTILRNFGEVERWIKNGN